MASYIHITQGIIDCNRQPALEIMPKAVSKSLYFVVGPYTEDAGWAVTTGIPVKFGAAHGR